MYNPKLRTSPTRLFGGRLPQLSASTTPAPLRFEWETLWILLCTYTHIHTQSQGLIQYIYQFPIHTYIHTYIHTKPRINTVHTSFQYIHTYIHTYVPANWELFLISFSKWVVRNCRRYWDVFFLSSICSSSLPDRPWEPQYMYVCMYANICMYSMYEDTHNYIQYIHLYWKRSLWLSIGRCLWGSPSSSTQLREIPSLSSSNSCKHHLLCMYVCSSGSICIL